ncbi:MAG: sugar transferase [Lentisphaerae bacterium]|nr:sugar transferase [Lentisphaerota bacterium]
MKRLADILLVLLFMPLWLPLLVVCAAAVAVFDGRPAMFFQERAGLGGRVFRMAKLRTMRPGAGTDRERTTRLGAFLRATSLDELPQLFHVLTGAMSLVGPRPLPAAYLPRYIGDEARRHEVRPGITGWAQVNGRNAISWEEKFALDVWYVDHRSLWLDAKILFMTVFGVLRRSGVNSSASDTMPELRPDASASAR